METVNVAELKTHLSSYLERVKNGAELVVKDRNRPIARLVPLLSGMDLDAEESALVSAGLLRMPEKKKSNSFFRLPTAQVSTSRVRAAIRAERDED